MDMHYSHHGGGHCIDKHFIFNKQQCNLVFIGRSEWSDKQPDKQVSRLTSGPSLQLANTPQHPAETRALARTGPPPTLRRQGRGWGTRTGDEGAGTRQGGALDRGGVLKGGLTLGGASSDPPESQDTVTCLLISILALSFCWTFSSPRIVL